MNFDEIVSKRRSIRKYNRQPVEREKVIKCIEAARIAPSAHNVQPWRFLVIDERDLIEKACDAAFSGIYSSNKWVRDCGCIVIILAKTDIKTNLIGRMIQGTNFYLIDIGISGEHLVLKASELGIGTCWLGWFNSKKLRKALSIPGKYKIAQLLSMGYYDENINLSNIKRLERDDILFFNKIM